MTTQQLKSATRDGITLRHTDTGAGDPPLVFIHGWTCNRTNWRGQAPFFEKKHRVVAVDLRGHGESDKPDQDYTIEVFADDVAWLIAEIGLEKPVIVGHSMGGVIALNLVRKHPGLAGAAVFIDSPLVPLPETARGLIPPLLAGMQSPAYKSVAEGFARMQFFNAKSPPELVDELVTSMSQAPQRLMHTAMMSILDEKSIPAGAIPVPSLFIGAGEPQIASPDELRARYPGIGVVTIPAAHFVMMEQPDATNNVISDFLDKLE
ncbi:MAG TPA: alpha/beta hydrolase [Dehalococcoidia bacterium]|nr:alpha/beta hydrolase [Dehalococcoidia bacterium]